MKIGSLENKALTPLAGERTPAPAAKTEKSAPESSTQVTLSPTATSLGDTGAEFDAAKVERISAAIRDGKFQVNAEAIADKLISNAQELLNRNAR
ncbi:flagellar biosynthesis anti-sigma factor FlgM [Aquincola sp. MAHUQ-54]|uniref:Negative regulator of flagellin synthesis n=1 Tax=Aquincola agrisoli TaxID=3119538 RepID=A0AAW9QE26_9BURK